MNISKKSAFGIAGVAAAGLFLVGASPAMASGGGWSGDTNSYSYDHSTKNYSHSEYTKTTTTVIAPEVNVLNGDIGNGNAVGSGNFNGDNLNGNFSGNETAIGNVSDVAVGNVSDVADVSDIGNVSDVIDNSGDIGNVVTQVTDVVDVDDILSDIGGWVDIDFED